MARPLMGVNLGMGNRSILGRPSPYDRMDRMDRGMGMGGMGLGRGRGNMRGLPFQCTDEDIVTFFEAFKPCGIFIKMQDDGRASGEADADFSSHEEAQEAMTKDKNTIKHRYIELFLRSSPSNNRRNNFGGGMDDYDEGFGPSYGNRGMGNGYNGSGGMRNFR